MKTKERLFADLGRLLHDPGDSTELLLRTLNSFAGLMPIRRRYVFG